MTPLIQKVVKLANITFSHAHVAGKDTLYEKSFASNLTNLKCLLGNLRASDVVNESGVDRGSKTSFFRRLLASRSRHHDDDDDDAAPVAYTEIFENDAFTIGMFVLRSAGVRIPLHDHPGMHGIIKVVQGTVTVKSYSPAMTDPASVTTGSSSRQAIPVKRLAPVVLDANSEPCCLSPDVGNYHEITAIDGPAAFVDILSPPYDHYDTTPIRECRYYRCVAEPTAAAGAGSAAAAGPDDAVLIECGQPMDFWTDNIAYSGPKIHASEHN